MSINEMLMAAAGSGGGDKLYVEDCFATHLYTGNGSTQTITNGIDLAGKGGLVWIKHRSGGGITPEDHVLYDTLRGVGKYIRTNSTGEEATGSNSLTAFNSNGFSLGADSTDKVNRSTALYASWTFREAPKFFDVVTYTGNSVSGRTISHSLGSEPGMIIIKCTSTATNWAVYHRSTGASLPLRLNLTNAASGDTGAFNNTNPTASVFTVGNDFPTNYAGETYVAYLFAHDAGGFGDAGTDNIISCGGFTSDGSGNATVNLGYEPQWLLLKAAGTTQNWFVVDTMRGYSQTNWNFLNPNTSGAETTYTPVGYAPNATGFFLGPDVCFANTSYIYMAIRRPMKKPTSGTEVFSPNARTGNGSTQTVSGLSFSPDLWLTKNHTGLQNNWAFDRLRGPNQPLSSNFTNDESFNTAAFFVGSPIFTPTNTGFTTIGESQINNASRPYIDYLFRRAPGFFDIVCYTGNGSNRTVAHNLGVAPELMIVKSRNTTGDWPVYALPLGSGTSKYLYLNGIAATLTTTDFWGTAQPTSSVFSVGVNGYGNNDTGTTYVAYLFASLPGVSSVGTYTGNGSSQTINCGFSAGARFVLIKRTDSTGDWVVFDTARGIVSGNDPFLQFNTPDLQVTNQDAVDPASSGFIVNETTENLNVNGATYIFLAIA